MPALFEWDDVVDDVDEEARLEAREERRRRARLRHWCSECHGRTGPGSPCAPDNEDDDGQG